MIALWILVVNSGAAWVIGWVGCTLAASRAAAATSSEGRDLSAEELLRRLKEATRWTENSLVKMKNEVGSIWENDPDRPEPIKHSMTVEIGRSRDGRLRISKTNEDEEGNFELFRRPEVRVRWGPGEAVYTELPEVINGMYGLDKTASFLGFPLDGVIGVNAKPPILHICDPFSLIGPARIIGSENIDGIDCSVVEATGAFGTLKIWIAPSRGFNFAKYSFEKSPERAAKTGVRKRTVDRVKFRRLPGGEWVIESGRYLEIVESPTEPIVRGTIEQVLVRTEIDASPDFSKTDFMSADSVPNGLRAFVLTGLSADGEANVSDLRYRWENGKPVRDLDSGMGK